MPEANNIEKKEHWIKKAWKTKVAVFAVLGALWGILEGVYWFTEKWHEWEVLKDNEVHMVERIDRLEENQKNILQYVENKRKSFAVGFRVFKEVDEITGEVTFAKRYRDWKGVWHEIFQDLEASRYYGVDYYYYIDKNSDEKIYCW